MIIHMKRKNCINIDWICLCSIFIKVIQNILTSHFVRTDLSNQVYWVGLTDITTEGKWIWENGSPFVSGRLTILFNNYDSSVSVGRFNADCGLFKISYANINDGNCQKLASFICEKN